MKNIFTSQSVKNETQSIHVHMQSSDCPYRMGQPIHLAARSQRAAVQSYALERLPQPEVLAVSSARTPIYRHIFDWLPQPGSQAAAIRLLSARIFWIYADKCNCTLIRMRCNSLECFAFFLFLIVSRGGASSISGKDNLFHENDLDSSSNSNESPLPVIPTIDYTYTARSCLYVSPDLPPCRFNRNDNSHRFHRSLDESNEGIKFKRKFPFEEFVTVYAIQGCLPSRLPFRMALCESKESLERATRIWKLYPFQGTDEDRKNSFVFPRFDLERWTREMKLLEEEERERRNGEKTVAKGGDPKDSFVQSQEYFPATTNLDREEEEKSAVSSIVRNHSRESRMEETRRRRRRRRDDKRRRRRSQRPEGGRSSRDRREIEEVKEFPYSKSISFDPTRLGHEERSNKFLRENLSLLLSRRSRDIRLGSEFPYWKAIPYDSKKHKFYGIVADHRVQKLQS